MSHSYLDRTQRVFRCVVCNKIIGGEFPDGPPADDRWCPEGCPGQPGPMSDGTTVLVATVTTYDDWVKELLPDIPPGVDPADMAWIESGTR